MGYSQAPHQLPQCSGSSDHIPWQWKEDKDCPGSHLSRKLPEPRCQCTPVKREEQPKCVHLKGIWGLPGCYEPCLLSFPSAMVHTVWEGKTKSRSNAPGEQNIVTSTGPLSRAWEKWLKSTFELCLSLFQGTLAGFAKVSKAYELLLCPLNNIQESLSKTCQRWGQRHALVIARVAWASLHRATGLETFVLHWTINI